MQPDTTLYPPVQPGMLVHWYFAGDTSEPPCPMLVSKVGEYALEGGVIAPGIATLVPKSGVLHVSNPDVKNFHRRESGGWDYTPETKALYQRLTALEQLVSKPVPVNQANPGKPDGKPEGKPQGK